MSTDARDIPCPWCGRSNDVHRALGDPGAEPTDGDVSLCMTCGQWAIFCVHPEGLVHLDKPQGGMAYAHIIDVMQGAAT